MKEQISFHTKNQMQQNIRDIQGSKIDSLYFDIYSKDFNFLCTDDENILYADDACLVYVRDKFSK